MMRQCRHGRQCSTLLPTTLRSSANEQASILTPEPTSRPLLASRVPESLPLSWEVSKSCWDAKEEGIVLLKGRGVDGWIGGFRTDVELGEDFFGERLGDSVRC